MSVFDLPAGLGHVDHAGAAEIVQLGEGFGLVVALLVGGGEERIGIRDDVVFQFAHGFEGHASGLVEGVFRPHERRIGGAVEGFAVLVEEAAQEAQRGNLVEGIHESGPVAGDYVQVAVAGLDEGGEEAGSVHPFALGQDRFRIGEAVHRKVQGLDATVFGRIHEVHHLDLLLADEGQQVFPGEFRRKLSEERHHFVGIEFKVRVHYDYVVFVIQR